MRSGKSLARDSRLGGLHRLRAAFGSIEILRIIDHNNGKDQNDEPIQEDEQGLPADP